MDTRNCKDCEMEKGLESFYISKKVGKTIYYASYCIDCHKKRTSKDKRGRTDENYLKLWRHYESNPCVDCGEDNPLKLSSDHQGKKTGNIGDLMKGPWKKVEAELKLCKTRCHNCHSVKTAASLGHFVSESLRDYVTSWPDNKKAYKEYAK